MTDHVPDTTKVEPMTLDELISTFELWRTEANLKARHDDYDLLTQVIGHIRDHRPALEAGMRGVFDPVKTAKAFHENYERLAPEYGYETRKETAVDWDNLPTNMHSLMVATVLVVFESLGLDAEFVNAEETDAVQA